MTGFSYINWRLLSDQAICEQVGGFIKHHRLDQNRSQEEIAAAAGISRSTLSLLERGKTVTINTLIRLLRVLDLLHAMDNFQVNTQISPIELAKLERDKRKRASGKTKNKESNR